MKYINLSGLPRCGSTLFGNILNQHPDITVRFDSGLPYIITNISNHSERVYEEGQFTIKQFEVLYTDFMRSGIASWVSNLGQGQFYIDKDRGWQIDYDLLFKLIPNVKIIYLMRDLRGVISSLEKIEIKKRVMPPNSSLKPSEMFEYHSKDLSFQRIETFLDDNMLHTPLYALKELLDCEKPYINNFKFIKYEDLMENPKELISDVYDFIGAKSFDNDLNNIKSGYYSDACFAPYGDHTIRKQLIPRKVEDKFPLLKQKSQERIIDICSWYYEEFYPEVYEKYKN